MCKTLVDHLIKAYTVHEETSVYSIDIDFRNACIVQEQTINLISNKGRFIVWLYDHSRNV